MSTINLSGKIISRATSNISVCEKENGINLEDIAKEIAPKLPSFANLDENNVINLDEFSHKTSNFNNSDVDNDLNTISKEQVSQEKKQSLMLPNLVNYANYILPKDFNDKKQSIDIPFSESQTNYSYNNLFLKSIEEKIYLGKNNILLDYAYSLENEIGLTLPIKTFGLSDNVFTNSTSHEIIEIDGIKYFSCKEKTLNKEKLDNLLKNLSESLSTINSFSMPMVASQIFSQNNMLYCIPTLSINTYEFNIIIDVCNKIGNVTYTLSKYEDQTYLTIVKQN